MVPFSVSIIAVYFLAVSIIILGGESHCIIFTSGAVLGDGTGVGAGGGTGDCSAQPTPTKPVTNTIIDRTIPIETKAKVYIAYNRRFFSSVMEESKIIKADGGITSLHFEFTEWADRIKELSKPKEVLNR